MSEEASATIEQLADAGLDVELESIISEFLKKDKDKKSAKLLRDAIAEVGLRGPKTMKAVGTLQRDGKIKPGLFKELTGLNDRYVASVEGDETASEETSEESGGATVAAEEEGTETDNVVEINQDGHLTEKEEDKIKERMQKEEEKLRKRLAAKESKIRERMKDRQEKRAQRSGMKLEELQAIKERKEKVKELTDQRKELSAKIKVLREEIKELRPKREKKSDKEKEAAKAAKAEAKAEAKAKKEAESKAS